MPRAAQRSGIDALSGKKNLRSGEPEKSRFTLDFIGQYEFLKNSPRAWARRTELVFCAYFGLKYDIIAFLDLSKKGRQLG